MAGPRKEKEEIKKHSKMKNQREIFIDIVIYDLFIAQHSSNKWG